MSKKDFVALAAAISEISEYRERARLAVTIANLCESSNHRFNRNSFYKACNV